VRRIVRHIRPATPPLTSSRRALLERLPKASVCAEIGVYKGEFSRQILEITQPDRLHLIDPWKFFDGDVYANAWYGRTSGGQAAMDLLYDDLRERLQAEIDTGRVIVHRTYSQQIAGSFPEKYFDWVYIDGNHLYEFVKRDLHAFRSRVKDGGFLAGDDYGVTGWWDDGVTRAVDEFVKAGFATPVLVGGTQFLLRKA
jgi:hypothetical protein